MTLCHSVCGSLEQDRGHGRLVSALPGSFLPPLMTSTTAAPEEDLRLDKRLVLSERTPLSCRDEPQRSGCQTFTLPPYECLYTVGASFVFPFLEVNGSSKIQSAKRSGTCPVSLHQKSQGEALETRRGVSSRLWIQCQLLLIFPTLSRHRRLLTFLKSPDCGSSCSGVLKGVNSVSNDVFVNT